MTKYENIIKQKDDRGPLDLTRQIGELQCEIAGLKTKVHDAELETSLVKAIGITLVTTQGNMITSFLLMKIED